MLLTCRMVQRSSSKGLRTQLAQLTLKASILFSILLGAMPLKYILKHRRMEESRVATFYCLAWNLVIIISAVVLLRQNLGQVNNDFFAKKELNTVISKVHATLAMLLVLVTFYRNWRGRERLLRVFKGIIQLDQQSFFPPQKSCELFDYYVIWKGAVGVMRSLSFIYIAYGLRPEVYSSLYILQFVFWLVVQYTLMIILNHYFFGLLYIYKQFWLLNEQLKDKFNSFSTRVLLFGQACEIAEEFDALMLLYMRLVRLCEELTALYDYQILIWLVFQASSNVASSFYFCVMLGGKIMEINFYYFTLFPQLVVINMLDLWLCIATCELLLTTANATPVILRSFNDFHNLDVQLLQRLNDFALLCTFERPRFPICGLFQLDHRTGHQFFITMSLYVLYLVQFDFMNL